MKQVSETLREKFDTNHSVDVEALVTAKFSHNRYGNPTVTNMPDEYTSGYDPDLFPIDSIVEPNRPLSGITKAIVGQTELVPGIVAMPAHVEDKYKYWLSPTKSNSAGEVSDVNPSVRYDRECISNRITVTFEVSQTKPVDWKLMVLTDVDGEWITISENAQLDDKGRLVLYFDGEDWTPTKTLDNHVVLWGVALSVTKIDESESRTSVIELGAELEKDMTPYLVGLSDTFDAGDADDVLPVGRLSANIGDLELWNILVDEDDPEKGFLFDNNNQDSIYFGLCESNVEFVASYTFTVESHTETVQQFIMYAEDRWAASTHETAQITLKDRAKFLQEAEAGRMLMENYKADRIIERLLHSVGWDKFVISDEFRQFFPMVSFYWTDGTTYIWEELQDLCRAHQIACWFDAYGILHVQPREELYNSNDEYQPVQIIRASDSGDSLANLEDGGYELENTNRSNVVNVVYRETDIEMNNYGEYLRNEAWKPDGDVIIGASDLQDNFMQGQKFIEMRGNEVDTWPYEGMFNVGGEICSYSGKEVRYYLMVNNNLTMYTEWVDSPKKYQEVLNKVAKANMEHMMAFTGKLNVTERGIFNSTQRDHIVFRPRTGVQSFRPSAAISRADVAAMLYQYRGAPPVTNPSVPYFVDVVTQHMLYTEITWMYQSGVSTGWPEPNGTRTYRPSQAVTRSELAAFLYRAANSPSYTPPTRSPFADLTTKSGFYKEICWMHSKGITTGYLEPNGTWTFRPHEPVLREQAAAFMYRYDNSPTYTAPATPPFSDVPKSHAFYKQIAWLADQGYINFYHSDGYRQARVNRESNTAASVVVPMGARPGTAVTFGSNSSTYVESPGKMRLVVTPSSRPTVHSDFYVITQGKESDIPQKYYGTRIRFPLESSTLPRGGIHFMGSGVADHGYYVEIRPTKYKMADEPEVRLISRTAGAHIVFKNFLDYEAPVINEDTWYSLDVRVNRTPEGDQVYVLIDGRIVLEAAVPQGSRPSFGGRFGLYCRNSTDVVFDYLYAVNGEVLDPDTETTFFDMYHGGYISDVLQKEYVASTVRYNEFKAVPHAPAAGYRMIDFYDEFGPVVHEIMPFDVKYQDNTPFISPILVSTNDDGTAIINPQLTPFNGKFWVANSGRTDEIIHGDLNDVRHTTTILGYAVRQAEEKNITVENRRSVRAHGKVELEITNTWLQSASEAQKLGDWIVEHWARAGETCSVSAFIPNHIEIGDIVTLDSSIPGVGETASQYFVISINTSWDNGLSTRLTLREA